MRASSRRWAASWRPLLLALAILVAVPQPARGQEYKGKRKFIYAVIGAVLVGVPTYISASDGEYDNFCSSKTCMGVVGASVGALIGFLIGNEIDAKHERRMAAGPSLDYQHRNVPLDLTPDRMVYFPGGAAVAGVGGARIVYRDGRTLMRGSGVRGIEDIAVLPSLDLLVLSTYSNLLAFPIEGDTAQGEVIDERGGGAMEAMDGLLAVAGLDSLRLLRVRRGAVALATEPVAGIAHSEFVTDMTHSRFGQVTWLLIEDRLVAYNALFEKVGELQLPVAGRAIRTDGSRLAIAAGSEGVFVFDVRDPALPRIVLEYKGVRFAYAADLEGDRMYVAAGPEGVAVVDISGSEPRVLGVAREVEFASDVLAAGDGEMWILDREGRRVQIADFATEAAGGPGQSR
ncbi:MAG TPA: hypothetical protein VLC48_00905 [Gemmatimonadota bacterium]|nr:hypothetical protein [Gemmatimonadota bacterium]